MSPWNHLGIGLLYVFLAAGLFVAGSLFVAAFLVGEWMFVVLAGSCGVGLVRVGVAFWRDVVVGE